MKLEELIHGKIDSNQHVAYKIRFALNPIKIFGVSTYSAKEEQWAIKLLAKAYNDYDFDFIRGQADGLEKLKSSDPTTSRDPRFFFSLAYSFLQRTSGTLPFRQDTIGLAKKIWAISRLTQRIPELPLRKYKPDFERKISIEMAAFPEQKWSRHCKAFGLKFSPAKRGRKPKGK